MTSRLAFFSFLVLLGSASGLAAQGTSIDTPELTASGEAYLDAMRLRGVETQVQFFDPNRPAPPFESGRQIEIDPDIDAPDVDLETAVGGGRVLMLVLMAMIVMGIVYLFLQFSGGSFTAFARQPDEGADGGRKTRQKVPDAPAATKSLQAILNMTDRNAALVALCKSLLARVVAGEGVLLQKSWTDRDTLRRVPRDHAHRDALQALVFDSERTQFGGRDVDEDTFRAHVTRLRPLLTGGAA